MPPYNRDFRQGPKGARIPQFVLIMTVLFATLCMIVLTLSILFTIYIEPYKAIGAP